jgi:hypothetical protein
MGPADIVDQLKQLLAKYSGTGSLTVAGGTIAVSSSVSGVREVGAVYRDEVATPYLTPIVRQFSVSGLSSASSGNYVVGNVAIQANTPRTLMAGPESNVDKGFIVKAVKISINETTGTLDGTKWGGTNAELALANGIRLFLRRAGVIVEDYLLARHSSSPTGYPVHASQFLRAVDDHDFTQNSAMTQANIVSGWLRFDDTYRPPLHLRVGDDLCLCFSGESLSASHSTIAYIYGARY